MRIRSEEVTGDALANAFDKIENKGKRVTVIRGPKNMLDQIRGWKRDIYNDEAQTLWMAKLADDESLDAVFVTDEK